MKLHKPNAEIFVPDGRDALEALGRTTHMGIGAHQDDLEMMAFHGVLQCFDAPDQWFTGVTSTNGSGSAREGVYASMTDEQMAAVRLEEQRLASRIGRYTAMAQLGYPSREVKDPADHRLADDLLAILKAARPRVIYTHNPADKHATHVAVMKAVVEAIKRLPANQRPERLLGCEVWRNLDWIPDDRKVILNVSGRENLAASLVGLYDSQVAGGKRYDLAAMGRWRANATFLESHATDVFTSVTFALDLTPVITDGGPTLAVFMKDLLAAFQEQIMAPFKS